MKKLIPKEVVIFEGCLTSRRIAPLRFANLFLMEKLGIDYILLEKEQCCGSPIFRCGAEEPAQKQLLHNLREIEKTGRDTVVTSCPGCGSTLKSPEADDRGIKVLHMIEVLAAAADEGELFTDGVREIPLLATGHYPCHIHRGMGVDCEVCFKKVIDQIPSMRYIRMREADACCGAGGAVRASQPDLAAKIRERKLEYIDETEADLVVTSCPFCEIHLGEGLREKKMRTKIISLPVLTSLAYPDFEDWMKAKLPAKAKAEVSK